MQILVHPYSCAFKAQVVSHSVAKSERSVAKSEPLEYVSCICILAICHAGTNRRRGGRRTWPCPGCWAAGGGWSQPPCQGAGRRFLPWMYATISSQLWIWISWSDITGSSHAMIWIQIWVPYLDSHTPSPPQAVVYRERVLDSNATPQSPQSAPQLTSLICLGRPRGRTQWQWYTWGAGEWTALTCT